MRRYFFYKSFILKEFSLQKSNQAFHILFCAEFKKKRVSAGTSVTLTFPAILFQTGN